VKRDFLYLTTSEVLVMHSLLIRQFGGSDGVRDFGLLEAALFRPQTGYYSTSQKIYSELIRLFDAKEFDFENLEKLLRKVVVKS